MRALGSEEDISNTRDENNRLLEVKEEVKRAQKHTNEKKKKREREKEPRADNTHNEAERPP